MIEFLFLIICCLQQCLERKMLMNDRLRDMYDLFWIFHADYWPLVFKIVYFKYIKPPSIADYRQVSPKIAEKDIKICYILFLPWFQWYSAVFGNHTITFLLNVMVKLMEDNNNLLLNRGFISGYFLMFLMLSEDIIVPEWCITSLLKV